MTLDAQRQRHGGFFGIRGQPDIPAFGLRDGRQQALADFLGEVLQQIRAIVRGYAYFGNEGGQRIALHAPDSLQLQILGEIAENNRNFHSRFFPKCTRERIFKCDFPWRKV